MSSSVFLDLGLRTVNFTCETRIYPRVFRVESKIVDVNRGFERFLDLGLRTVNFTCETRIYPRVFRVESKIVDVNRGFHVRHRLLL
jgi:hypothetical protein